MPDHINDSGMPIHTAPFSTMVRDDNHVFLSGLVATDMEGGQAVVGDIAKETHLVMTMIKRLLASVGLNMEDIVRVDVHLTDLNDMDAMKVIYGALFAEGKNRHGPPPSQPSWPVVPVSRSPAWPRSGKTDA
jgi:2-iminobutanoate/2-iminopropanoate deaminase